MTTRTAMVVVAMLAAATPTVPARAQSAPAAAGEALMAADRAYAAAGAKTDAVSALTAMFAPDVIMPGPPAALHRGLAAVTAALHTNPWAVTAIAHGACTRLPRGESRHTRQSPRSSRHRSITSVRSSGTAPVAA